MSTSMSTSMPSSDGLREGGGVWAFVQMNAARPNPYLNLGFSTGGRLPQDASSAPLHQTPLEAPPDTPKVGGAAAIEMGNVTGLHVPISRTLLTAYLLKASHSHHLSKYPSDPSHSYSTATYYTGADSAHASLRRRSPPPLAQPRPAITHHPTAYPTACPNMIQPPSNLPMVPPTQCPAHPKRPHQPTSSQAIKQS